MKIKEFFLKGRFIGENVRQIYDLMQYAEEKEIPGLLLLIDFEKAFDSISWNFITKVLTYFNFGNYFKNVIHTLFQKASLCVTQHGFFSQFFNIGRGCRQGDPLSPYLFIMCVEILGILIRNDKDIKGIKVGNKEFKLSQYADDTGLTLDGSDKALKKTLDLLTQYAKYSGLKPNIEKTKCIWFGTKKLSTDRICANNNLFWSNEPFTFPGVKFSPNLSELADLNYCDKLKEIKSLIHIWSKRCLSPIGRITVVKSIILSKLTHLFISIRRPDKDFVKILERLIYNFIWGRKNDKIS
ncbi:hypothetical protein CI610_03105 [invertebrate metagenome]|uniref:Reverse transcriptase domain-containing protein n=1 Tax=invertebrate metagenome TaxID=1711999 RepID=A0A2H9T407_9ZZZZ